MTDRPENQADEIDRTGRDEQVAGKDIAASKSHEGFGTPGTPAEQVPPGLENDVA